MWVIAEPCASAAVCEEEDAFEETAPSGGGVIWDGEDVPEPRGAGRWQGDAAAVVLWGADGSCWEEEEEEEATGFVVVVVLGPSRAVPPEGDACREVRCSTRTSPPSLDCSSGLTLERLGVLGRGGESPPPRAWTTHGGSGWFSVAGREGACV